MLQFNATFWVAMFSFIVFIIIMDRILYKPISKIVNERDEFIAKNYKDAEKNQAESTAIRKNREDRLLKSKTDARKIISEKVDFANKTAKEKTENAILESRKEISSIKENLQNKEQEVLNNLEENISDIADSITDKLLNGNLSDNNINKV